MGSFQILLDELPETKMAGDKNTLGRQPLAVKLVSVFFWLSAANLLIVFFVQGGYEFYIGSFQVHARTLRNSLLLCLALGVAKTLLLGRREGLRLSARLRSPLVLFLSVILIYSLNHQTHGSTDTFPARYLPLSIVRELNFDLDEFRFLYEPDFPYFLKKSNGHVVSAYPPWAGLLALPVYLVPVLQGLSPQSLLIEDLEKRAALLITALSVIVLYFALRRLTREKIAWLITIVYAFGTSSFSTSSQGLWQHGPSQLFLALTLYYLVRGLEDSKFSVFAGLFLGIAVMVRPLNIVIALPIGAYILHQHRERLVGLLLACVPPLLLFVAYNSYYFGSPFTTGFAGTVVSPSSLRNQSSWFNTPLLEGLLSVLVSPSRGLLAYSPIFLFSFVGMAMVWKEPGRVLFKYLSLAPILMIIPVAMMHYWFGGCCYGPRLLADITPILCLFLIPIFEQARRQTLLRYAVAGMAAFSIAVHALGAYDSTGWYEKAKPFMHPESLWSWADSAPVYNAKEMLANVRQEGRQKFLSLKGVILATPTSVDAPQKLAASYSAVDLPSELTVSPNDMLRVHVKARNVGEAIWLANPEVDDGSVRLGWRWLRADLEKPAKEGRKWLPYDIFPGQSVEFRANIPSPPMPGEYTLEIGILSEPGRWFSAQDVKPLKASVHVVTVR